MRLREGAELVAVQQFPGLRAPCSSTTSMPRPAICAASSGSIARYGVMPVPVPISR